MPPQTQRVRIMLAGQPFDIQAPAGMTDDQIVSLATAENPDFASAYSQYQAGRETQKPLVEAVRQRDQNLQALSQIAGYKTAPRDEAEAAHRLAATTGKYAAGEGALYSAADLVADPVAFAKGAARSAIGAAGGSFIGSEIGRPWGKEAEKVGSRVGTIAGGAAGAFAPELIGGHLPTGRVSLLRRVLGMGGKAEEAVGAATPKPTVPKYGGRYDPIEEFGQSSGAPVRRVTGPSATEREAEAQEVVRNKLKQASTGSAIRTPSGIVSPAQAAAEQGMWSAGTGEGLEPNVQRAQDARRLIDFMRAQQR